MDRLTERDEFGIKRVCHYPSKDGDKLLYGSCWNCENRALCNSDIIERLAQYEDAEEIEDRSPY